MNFKAPYDFYAGCGGTCVTFIQNEDPTEQKAYRVRENELNVVGDFRELSDKDMWAIARQIIKKWPREN